MPVTRKRKIEVARLAGFGLVLAGLFALFLAVVSSQDAGAEKPSPRVTTLRCEYTYDTTGDGIGDAVQYGACQTTTSVETQGSTTTSKPKHQCGCSTTTTAYVTTTTHQCGCSTTTTEATTTTTEETTTTTEATTTTEETTTTVQSLLPSTSAPGEEATTTLGGQGAPVTSATTGVEGGSPVGGGSTPVSEAEAVSGQLPFTGSSSLALAGFGVLMVATGLALALRRRRFAR